MAEYVGGYLGLILGAAAGALLDQGHTVKELHDWVDQAARSRELAPKDGRTAEAARLLTEFAEELRRFWPRCAC